MCKCAALMQVLCLLRNIWGAHTRNCQLGVKQLLALQGIILMHATMRIVLMHCLDRCLIMMNMTSVHAHACIACAATRTPWTCTFIRWALLQRRMMWVKRGKCARSFRSFKEIPWFRHKISLRCPNKIGCKRIHASSGSLPMHLLIEWRWPTSTIPSEWIKVWVRSSEVKRSTSIRESVRRMHRSTKSWRKIVTLLIIGMRIDNWNNSCHGIGHQPLSFFLW